MSNVVYGVWNGMTKRFVYGIREPSKRLAQKRLFEAAGKGAYCWRYEIKPIPDKWVNPKNIRFFK